MRSDVSGRREALLQTAILCFEDTGFEVSLEEVAARAGVGRATLYRCFKDRMALLMAIFEREIERLEMGLDTDLPLEQVISLVVRRGLFTVQPFTRFRPEGLPFQQVRGDLEALGRRLECILGGVIAAARQRGDVRADLTPGELFLAIRMISGTVDPRPSDARAGDGTVRQMDQIDCHLTEAIDLIMRGLGPG